jgi:hypothetical protein
MMTELQNTNHNTQVEMGARITGAKTARTHSSCDLSF